jgi:hypothetical protein
MTTCAIISALFNELAGSDGRVENSKNVIEILRVHKFRQGDAKRSR